MRLLILILCLLLLGCSGVIPSAPTPVGSGDNMASAITAFYFKKKLLFNTTATGANIVVDASEPNFPICVHINSSSWPTAAERIAFFGASNVNGKRIQFFDTDLTGLDYEVELYSLTSAQVVVLASGTSWNVPTEVSSVKVFLVGAGAGGNGGVAATHYGGGGGGGEWIYDPAYVVTPGGTVTYGIGAGSAGVNTGTPSDGGDTTFGTLTARGGHGAVNTDHIGGATHNGAGYYAGGHPPVLGAPIYEGGAGAGAGGTPGTGSGTSKNGGIGYTCPINATKYGGGGASASYSGGAVGGTYEAGGGTYPAGNGTANTGGGGAGANNATAGNGGSGVIVIEYTAPEAIYWVRVPSVAGNSTTDYIWVGFGNDPNLANQDNPEGVWNSDYKLVQHLGDNSFVPGGNAASLLRMRNPAIRYSGTYNRTYRAWVSQSSGGSAWINYTDNDSGLPGTAVMLSSNTVADVHGSPAMLIIPSGDNAGKILVAWGYGSTGLALYRSTNSEDISAWETVQTDADALGYINMVHLGDGKVALFTVVLLGASNYGLAVKTSSDGGATWTGLTTLVNFGADKWIYPVVVSSGNTVHVAWHHLGSAQSYQDVYYMYNFSNLDADSWRTQGSATKITLPATLSPTLTAELVYDHDGVWVDDIQVDGSGSPVITCVEYVNATTANALWAHYSSGWSVHDTGVNTLIYPSSILAYNSGIFIDPVTTTHVYIGAYNSDTATDIEEWHLNDHDTNDWDIVTQITTDSTLINGEPKPVVNYASNFKITYSVISSWTSNLVWTSGISNESGVLVTAKSAIDSTSNSNDGTDVGTTDYGGIVGRGRDFDGSNDEITAPMPFTTTTETLSAWINADSFAQYAEIVYNGSIFCSGIMANQAGDGKWGLFLGGHGWFPSNLAAATGAWHYITLTYDQSNWYIHDNTTKSTAITHTPSTPTGVFCMAKNCGNGARFNGKQGGARLSNTVRSDDWINLEYYSMAKTSYNGDNGVSAPFITWDAAIASGNVLFFGANF